MEIVETGGIVAEGRDSWWSSLIEETAGWSSLLVERVGDRCCRYTQLDDRCPGCAVLVDVISSVDASPTSESFVD